MYVCTYRPMYMFTTVDRYGLNDAESTHALPKRRTAPNSFFWTDVRQQSESKIRDDVSPRISHILVGVRIESGVLIEEKIAIEGPAIQYLLVLGRWRLFHKLSHCTNDFWVQISYVRLREVGEVCVMTASPQNSEKKTQPPKWHLPPSSKLFIIMHILSRYKIFHLEFIDKIVSHRPIGVAEHHSFNFKGSCIDCSLGQTVL